MSVPQTRKVLALALVAGLGFSLAACGEDKGSNAKVTITVDCMPVEAQKELRADWLADVDAFQKLHPNITIKSISVGSQCNNPPDFTARLRGGTQADVFYAYMTDLQQVLDSGQAQDISQYINDETVPTWNSIDGVTKTAFAEGGKTYGIPTKNYTMGLVINKPLFKAAGLDPAKPPSSWADVRSAAAAIARATPGTYGYGEYSAQNTGGWHFTATMYGLGGSMVTPDGKKANFNNDLGKSILQNLKDMRAANSVGDKQLLGWGDLLTLAGAGKVGMFLGAPDATTAIVTQFKGKYEDWAMGPLPGKDGAGAASLGGGEGYFFKKGLSAEQIKAGLMWLSYEKLTPGKGQFDYVRAKPEKQPVGLPQPQLFSVGSAAEKQETDLKKANANITVADFEPFASKPITIKLEPPQAQAIYAVLDGPMSAVLTDPNADINKLLSDAEAKVNTILANG